MSHKPDPSKNVTLTINGQSVTVPEGTRILEAAKKVNARIPTLCEHPDLCKRAWCRICVVETDGRGKLIAACANDVWEGANIVTNNLRLLDIRKTILELILANHPQDCLSCIRNKNCELQSLAAEFNIRSSSFERTSADSDKPQIESDTIVRDMDKCIKCGRCVEACQEVQTIRAINTSCRSHKFEISAPYKQSLKDSSCVFCGKCALMCPVSAIYTHDQSAEVQAALNESVSKDKQESRVIAQISPELPAVLDSKLDFAAGTITAGKIIAVLKLLGFDKIFETGIAIKASNTQMSGELEERIKAKKSLPLISGRPAESAARFVKNFFPDLADRLAVSKSPRRIFAETIKSAYAQANGFDVSKITSVSFVPDISKKYGSYKNDYAKGDFALTAGELARMIKASGIKIEALQEKTFDTIEIPNQNGGAANTAQKETIRGFAEARKILEAVRKGDCNAKWIEII